MNRTTVTWAFHRYMFTISAPDAIRKLPQIMKTFSRLLPNFCYFANTDSNDRGINEEEISIENEVPETREISDAEDYEVLAVESSQAPIHQESDSQPIAKNKRKFDGKTANNLIFARYAKTLNSFSLKSQAITRIKIAQIIAEQELKHIEEMEFMTKSSSSPGGFLSPSPTPLLAAHSPSPVYIDSIPILMEANLSSGQPNYTSDE
ncbi:hypothetical protein CBL_20767 [Carabus blaptoides fortunei]